MGCFDPYVRPLPLGGVLIPATVDEWTLEVVNELLAKAVFESEIFDFKEKLPHSKDESGKERLRKTCTAFANSEGGFLVLGVSDDRAKHGADRIIGIESDIEVPQQFGAFPAACHPSIYWTFKNPALKLDSGKLIHVIHIPKSWSAPHATGRRDTGWYFCKRTNQGNEHMSVDEIRQSFLGFYEKKLKLELMRAELINIQQNAAACASIRQDQMSSQYSLVTFDLTLIDSTISDTYTITARYPVLLQLLTAIRNEARIINNKARIFYGVSEFPLSNKGELVRQHNEFIRTHCSLLMSYCGQALTQLQELLVKSAA